MVEQKNHSVTILGCGSSLPTRSNFPSSQVLQLRDKQFLIDCGEGTQIRMRQMGFKTSRLGHIFISHLHGDHCFGLIGLLSSWGMLGRTSDLYIHAHPDLQRLLQPQLDYFCAEVDYKIYFEEINPNTHAVLYEDRGVKVSSIPLRHRVPCTGFLFEEKLGDRHLNREMADFYQVPIHYFPRLKRGDDFVAADGNTIANARLTFDPTPAVKYAYCADTAYSEKIIPLIEGVDCLYHEATFTQELLVRATQTKHSTAAQAATIAQKAQVKKLIIGHFSARYNTHQQLLKEAQAIFPNTVLGVDCSLYDLR